MHTCCTDPDTPAIAIAEKYPQQSEDNVMLSAVVTL
jgi:hypothetical protein